MFRVHFKPSFLRALKKLPPDLRAEAIEKIEMFGNPKNHQLLKVHKLRGELKGFYSFSVNYQYRVLFEYLDPKKTEAVLLAIGDHSVYKQ